MADFRRQFLPVHTSYTVRPEAGAIPLKSLAKQIGNAEAAGKDRTQFVLDAATREATTVLLDQRYFQLDTDAFAKFNAALDASPAENPRLRELLSRKAPWER